MSNHYFAGEAIFSAGGVLADKSSKKFFLVHKTKTNEWLLPKGRVEEGETLEQTAEREIFEETGYKNRPLKLLSVQVRPDIVDSSKNKVIFWFCSLLSEGGKVENTQAEGEDFTGKWFDVKEALTVLKWEDDKKLVGMSAELLG